MGSIDGSSDGKLLGQTDMDSSALGFAVGVILLLGIFDGDSLGLITGSLIRHSFFPQFCGGENHSYIVNKMSKLKGLGINTILDYSAEDERAAPST